MTKEQEEAVERLEKRIKDNEDYKTTQVWLTDDVSAVYTVLNMLKDYVKEIEKKDKIIDLMAEDWFLKEGYKLQIYTQRNRTDDRIFRKKRIYNQSI